MMPKSTNLLRAAVFGCFSLLLSAIPALSGEITIHDAYARASGAAAQSGAIFMVIENTGETDDRLIGAKTESAMKAELHTHIEDANGVMMMREIDGGIQIPAHDQHSLKRGGDHVMLMGITKPLIQGETLTMTLTFSKAGDMVVEVPIDNAHKP
ncbi:MAG: copper chaperone PCu(A)C [Proteobacteria bacterium]|nr:copper chaperone PCu(A)C [Pseudomonadota bacterium]